MDDSPKRVSTLLRVAVWLFVFCAAMAAVWLFYESFLYVNKMPGEGWDFPALRIAGLVVVNLLFTVVLVTFGLLYLWVRMARSLPDLQGWHIDRPESEFVAADADGKYTLDNYLAQEERVFKELDAFIEGPWASQSPVTYSRYHAESVCNPETIVDRNWNRSYVLEASEPLGGVLLIHGLSDAPYSLRAFGQRLHNEGYTVIWLRIPGHGTSPSALANVSWHDWSAAVKVGMKGLRDRMPDGCPMYLAGYSNGGALSVHYALESIADKSLPQLQGIMLFSPMIGINPMAKITRLYHMVALVSRNQKAQWSSVDAEIDPFKFSSWPMNANVQAWAVTQEVERQITKLDNADRMEEMPPVIAMQSVVDSTVVVPKLITVLFDRLKSESSELCLFDINRVDQLGNLFNRSFEQKIVPKLKRTDLPFRLTVFRNGQSDSHEVTIQTRDGESWVEESTGMSWPDGIVSLSHIAVPIPPDDLVYGTWEATAGTGLSLGSLSMRAEPSALLISDSLFVRSRHNPFYELLENRLIDWLKKATVNSSIGKS
jgi:alpha-beta hydrolase superfamily lysophospholipase